MSITTCWDYPNPFQMTLQVTEKDLDSLGHVNNVVYIAWLEKIALEHSEKVGLDKTTCSLENCALVVRRHEVDYLASALVKDELTLSTWITENDNKVSVVRSYQVIRNSDNACLLRAKTKAVCVNLLTGNVKRMPKSFKEAYSAVRF